MAASVLLARQLRRRKEKILWQIKDRSNPFELEENQFVDKFRLSREAVMHLCVELRPYVKVYHTGFSLELQVLLFLRVIGTGSFQTVAADTLFAGVSQPTTSRSVHKILNGIIFLYKKYIKFPRTFDDITQVKHGFFMKRGFPNVVGAIDCTHIVINKPNCEDWFVFVNRKSHFSINIQMVCDSNLKILDVVARWPGSTHDSFIWTFSNLKRAISTGTVDINGYLLGDSGYPLEPWLLTPYASPCCPQENTFNFKHSSTRNVIERCFGVLKSRFRLLHGSGGTLLYDPKTVCQFVVAGAILHNICIQHRVEEPDICHEDSPEDPDLYHEIPSSRQAAYSTASSIRDELALKFQNAL